MRGSHEFPSQETNCQRQGKLIVMLNGILSCCCWEKGIVLRGTYSSPFPSSLVLTTICLHAPSNRSSNCSIPWQLSQSTHLFCWGHGQNCVVFGSFKGFSTLSRVKTERAWQTSHTKLLFIRIRNP